MDLTAIPREAGEYDPAEAERPGHRGQSRVLRRLVHVVLVVAQGEVRGRVQRPAAEVDARSPAGEIKQLERETHGNKLRNRHDMGCFWETNKTNRAQYSNSISNLLARNSSAATNTTFT